MMDAARIEKLQQFVNLCESDLSILNDPSVSFFRSYIESLGGKVPPSSIESKPYVVEECDKNVEVPQDEEEDVIVESDIGFKGETVEPDIDPPQKMGDSSVEIVDENRDASQVAKAKGTEAISKGNLEEAIEQLTRAILLNPASAIMYATRATVYIKMKKPNAAIRDADAALKINPDSAKGYKSRGIARTMLGQWEEAAKDLHIASKLDYDEEISSILKKVEPNANKIEDRRRKYDKLQKEREDKKSERERQRRRAEAKAAYENAKKQEQASSSEKPSGFPGGMPGGSMPGGGIPGSAPGGGMPGGIDYSKILNDPELMTAFQDPEVMAALQICKEKPANLANHQANPKVAPIITKMMNKFGGPK